MKIRISKLKAGQLFYTKDWGKGLHKRRLIFQEASNSGLIAKIMTIAILMGIWICAWFFGFGNQIEEFDQTYTLDREHGIVEVIKDWMVNFISSILDNSRFF